MTKFWGGGGRGGYYKWRSSLSGHRQSSRDEMAPAAHPLSPLLTLFSMLLSSFLFQFFNFDQILKFGFNFRCFLSQNNPYYGPVPYKHI